MSIQLSIGILLVLSILPSFAYSTSPTIQGKQPEPFLQATPQQYVTLLPRVPNSSPSPWLIYPTGSTIWVAGIATGNPPISEIRAFWINGTSKQLLTVKNITISAIMADASDPSGKIWFTENSTLASYQIGQANATKALTLQSQSIEYLAFDSQHRIWMTSIGSSGTSNIIMYNPPNNSNQTYSLPTKGALVQGLTVATDNTIWFAEAGSKKIGQLIPGSAQPIEYSPPSSINLASPTQVAVDSAGKVWFTDHGSNQFGVLDPLTSVWKAFPIGYCADNCLVGLPNAIFVDTKNTIWFSEHIAGRVGHFDPSTGLLTEYSVPGSGGSSFPLMWWAMPGPNDLVWFVANGYGQIGYVNASIPLSLSISSPTGQVLIQRGSTQRVSVQVNSQAAEALSFGVFPVTQDQAFQFPAQIYGSAPSSLTLNGNSQPVSFSISAAWNATLGPRYVALTASSGQVDVNVQVLVSVVDGSAPFVTLSFTSAIALGSLIIYLRRPKKPKVGAAKKIRR